jgi:hypothetical protein
MMIDAPGVPLALVEDEAVSCGRPPVPVDTRLLEVEQL